MKGDFHPYFDCADTMMLLSAGEHAGITRRCRRRFWFGWPSRSVVAARCRRAADLLVGRARSRQNCPHGTADDYSVDHVIATRDDLLDFEMKVGELLTLLLPSVEHPHVRESVPASFPILECRIVNRANALRWPGADLRSRRNLECVFPRRMNPPA